MGYKSAQCSKTLSKIYKFTNFQICACCEKYLKDNKQNSFYLAKKYASIFVLGYNLFLKAHS